MTDRKKLRSIQSGDLDRRSILLLACAACGACSEPPGPDAGDAGPDASPDDDLADVASMDDVSSDQDDASSDAVEQDAGPVCNDELGSDLGPASMFAPGTWTKIRTPNVIVAHDEHGIYAYSGACTHFAVTLPAPTGSGPPSEWTSTCPVALGGHGSIYDNEGRVLRQPNNGGVARNLDHFRVTICDGHVWVGTGSANVVPIGTRVVP